jgi:hypothetical protein
MTTRGATSPANITIHPMSKLQLVDQYSDLRSFSLFVSVLDESFCIDID